MDIESNNIDIIERFFSNQLSEKELKQFDQRIQEDIDFAQEVNLYRSVYQATSIPNKMTLAKAQQKKNNWPYFVLPLILACSFLVYYLNPFLNTNNEPIQQTTPPLNDPTNTTPEYTPPVDTEKIDNRQRDPPSNKEPVNDKLAMAKITKNYLTPYELRVKKSGGYDELYRQKKYAEVIELISPQLSTLTGSEKTEAELLLATSLIFELRYSEAIDILSPLAKNDAVIRQKADVNWYLALAYLLNENPEPAILILESLKNSKHQAIAAELLSKLIPN